MLEINLEAEKQPNVGDQPKKWKNFFLLFILLLSALIVFGLMIKHHWFREKIEIKKQEENRAVVAPNQTVIQPALTVKQEEPVSQEIDPFQLVGTLYDTHFKMAFIKVTNGEIIRVRLNQSFLNERFQLLQVGDAFVKVHNRQTGKMYILHMKGESP